MWYRGEWGHLHLSRCDSKAERVFEGTFESNLNTNHTASKPPFFDSIAHLMAFAQLQMFFQLQKNTVKLSFASFT